MRAGASALGSERAAVPVGCAAFCDHSAPEYAGREKPEDRAAAAKCVPLCGMDNYNWKVGALLLGWAVPPSWPAEQAHSGPSAARAGVVVPGTAVEAGIYFWAAVRECPAACAAWEGAAVAFLVLPRASFSRVASNSL